MDPNETLREALAALTCNDRDSACDALESLHNWLCKGGFMPNVTATDEDTYTIGEA